MIECCEENIYYKNKRRKRIKNKKHGVIIAIIIFCAIFILYLYSTNNILRNIGETYAKSYGAESINSAVKISLNDGINYTDLITIDKDDSGNVSLMTTNSYKINQISQNVTETTKILLDSKLSQGVKVPIFAFTGIPGLEGYGKPINHKLLSISTVNCEFYGEFKSVGINQTLHSIFVRVTVEINVETIVKSKTISVGSSILICETVIVGKVPEIYLTRPLV